MYYPVTNVSGLLSFEGLGGTEVRISGQASDRAVELLLWSKTRLEVLGDIVFVQAETNEDYLALAVAAVLRPFRGARLAVNLLVHTLHSKNAKNKTASQHNRCFSTP